MDDGLQQGWLDRPSAHKDSRKPPKITGTHVRHVIKRQCDCGVPGRHPECAGIYVLMRSPIVIHSDDAAEIEVLDGRLGEDHDESVNPSSNLVDRRGAGASPSPPRTPRRGWDLPSQCALAATPSSDGTSQRTTQRTSNSPACVLVAPLPHRAPSFCQHIAGEQQYAASSRFDL